MKKFDLRKWMKEQKDLPKNKRSLTSKIPVKSQLNESEIISPISYPYNEEAPKLLNEQAIEWWTNTFGDNVNLQWWDMSCPSQMGAGSTHSAHLYVCVNGTTEVYRFTSTPGVTDTNFNANSGLDLPLTNAGITTINSGNDMQQDLHNKYQFTFTPGYCDNPDPSNIDQTSCEQAYPYGNWTPVVWDPNTNFPTNYWNNSAMYHAWGPGGMSYAFIDGIAPNIEGITPIDVMHFCMQNPGSSLGANSNFICPTNDDCGGIWVGDQNHNPIVVSTPVPVAGTVPGLVIPNSGYYNGILDYTTFGFYNWVGPVEFRQNQILGFNHAYNNCNGPNGVCDDSNYIFGCLDDGLAVNHLEEITTSNFYGSGGDMYVYDPSANGGSGGWAITSNTLGSFYGGLSGLDNSSYNQYSLDAATGTWSDSGTPLSGDPAGCGTNGVPDPTNKECCLYIGCPSDSGTAEYPVTNLGLWDPADAATYVEHISVGSNTPTIVSTDVNSYIGKLGCPSAADPSKPDLTDVYSCCEVVACPSDYDPLISTGNTSRYDSQAAPNQNHEDPFTWTVLSSLNIDLRTNAKVGCDTAGMIGDPSGTTPPTGIPNPADYSCCTPVTPLADLDIGCHDIDALNYNINSNDGSSITAVGCAQEGGQYDGLIADPNNYSCCNYEGCPDATLHPGGGPSTGTNLATNAGHFGVSILALASVPLVGQDGLLFYELLDSTKGKFGCKNGATTDILAQDNFECCDYPDWGC